MKISLKLFTLLGWSVMTLSGCILGKSATETAPPAIRPVKAIQVQAQATQEEMKYAGEIRPRYETKLSFRVAGQLLAREVETGQVVKAGQVLARLDMKDFDLDVATIQAKLASAEADAAQAQSELKRYRGLAAQNFISASALSKYETVTRTTQAKIDELKAQLGQTQNRAQYTTLVADHDGIVTGLDAEVGQVVNAGQSIVRVARLTEKEVVIHIPENRLDEFKKEHSLKMTLWAEPNQTYQGVLREIAPEADAITRTYTAKISLPHAPESIQFGMTATVYLTQTQADPYIHLPLTALYQKKEKSAVWVVQKQTNGQNKVHLHPVHVAGFKDNDVLIQDGLQAGQTIIIAGVNQVYEGQIVKVNLTKKQGG